MSASNSASPDDLEIAHSAVIGLLAVSSAAVTPLLAELTRNPGTNLSGVFGRISSWGPSLDWWIQVAQDNVKQVRTELEMARGRLPCAHEEVVTFAEGFRGQTHFAAPPASLRDQDVRLWLPKFIHADEDSSVVTGKVLVQRWLASVRFQLDKFEGGSLRFEYDQARVRGERGRPEPKAAPPRRVGASMMVRGQGLVLTPQLAELLELALRPDGIPFDEVRSHFSWDNDASAIRARVAKLGRMLVDATRYTPFVIEITTKGECLRAEIRPKPTATE